jgi:hypothetical protein
MSSDPLAHADIWTGAPSDTEYDAVYAAVTATERGRWFLAEYANRNRNADTQLLANALARIEAAVGRDAPPQAMNGATSAAAAGAAVAPIGASPTAVTEEQRFAAEIANDDESPATLFDMELAESKKLAEAIAELGSPLSSLTEPVETDPEPQSGSADSVIPPPDYTPSPAPPTPPQSAAAPRWYIEPPDFVFRSAEPKPISNGRDESSGESRQARPAPAELQLSSRPEDDPADLFEQPGSAASAQVSAPQISAPQIFAPAQVPTPAEGPPPQLRVANGATPPATPRPTLNETLVGLRGLSEDELIALFG